MNTKSLYQQLRARSPHYTARDAIAAARRHIAGPLATYEAAMAAWRAQPDKRHYAAGGHANRPKFPQLYAARAEPCEVDGLRDCGFVDELFPRTVNHRGWFADDMQDEIYRGQVWQLPARNGQCQYVAGYVEAGGYTVLARNDDGSIELFAGDNPGNHWDKPEALKEAARAANNLAERNAEKERDHSERWTEANQASDAREEARTELSQARKEARAVVAALREIHGQPAALTRDVLCKQLTQWRDAMRDALEVIETKTAEIANLEMDGEF